MKKNKSYDRVLLMKRVCSPSQKGLRTATNRIVKRSEGVSGSKGENCYVLELEEQKNYCTEVFHSHRGRESQVWAPARQHIVLPVRVRVRVPGRYPGQPVRAGALFLPLR